MTTFDRAFIKAFTECSPRPSAAPRPDAPPRPNADDLACRDTAPPPAAIDERTAPPAADRDVPRPLSSFAAQPKIHDACRALLEIDRAVWPAAVSELLARASRPWDHFAEHIIERTRDGQKCIAIASSERGDGRTTVALALARHAAARGLRLVVVDADFENPALVRSCGVSVRTGWDDLISSELELGEALISAVEDGVTLLPWRGGAASLAQLAGSMRVAGIFATLREHYDLLVLDTLPLGGRTTIADFAGFAAAIHADALYLVQNVRTTSREQMIAASAKLRRAGLPLAGVIENFVSSAGGDEPPGFHKTPVAAGRRLAVHGS
jgi:Mrp family chromosome partitioning ATPase